MDKVFSGASGTAAIKKSSVVEGAMKKTPASSSSNALVTSDGNKVVNKGQFQYVSLCTLLVLLIQLISLLCCLL